MNRYHLQVMTGHLEPGYVGLVSFTVEAEAFTIEHNTYMFYVVDNNNRQVVAAYPMNVTIIVKIEKI